MLFQCLVDNLSNLLGKTFYGVNSNLYYKGQSMPVSGMGKAPSTKVLGNSAALREEKYTTVPNKKKLCCGF